MFVSTQLEFWMHPKSVRWKENLNTNMTEDNQIVQEDVNLLPE